MSSRKDDDAFIRQVWSFAGNGVDYICSKDKEQALSEAMQYPCRYDRNARKCSLCQFASVLMPPQSQNRCIVDLLRGRIQRVQDIAKCAGQLCEFSALTQDYREVPIDRNGVIYCDPPYSGTTFEYCDACNSSAFWTWAASQPVPVFVSEYNAPSGWCCVWQKEKRSMLSTKRYTDCLFLHERWIKWYEENKQ